jgi:hypothetical protein
MNTEMVSAALFGAFLLLRDSNEPGWMDFTIAGYALKYDRAHSQALIFDKARGFYLRREIECDGGILTLELTRDRRDVADGENVIDGRDVHGALHKSLRSLSTGKGITIGDTPSKVVNRLGKPSKIERSGERRQFTDYVYIWKSKESGGNPLEYTETYTFKRSLLIQIVFFRDAGG